MFLQIILHYDQVKDYIFKKIFTLFNLSFLNILKQGLV